MLADRLVEALQHVDPLWVVALLSALPISEVRGGIPYGIAVHLPLRSVLCVAVLSNIIAVLPVLWGFDWLADRFAEKPLLGGIIQHLIRRARSKQQMVEKYGVFAVTLFVAVPLPITGAWTGSLVAAVFGMPFWKAVGCLAMGVLIASAISLAGVQIFNAVHLS